MTIARSFGDVFRNVSVGVLLCCSCSGLAGVAAQAQTGAPVPPPAAAAPPPHADCV